MPEETNNFKLDAKEFEGYTRATFAAMKENIDRLEMIVNKLTDNITTIKIKIYTGAAIISLLITMVTLLVSKHL